MSRPPVITAVTVPTADRRPVGPPTWPTADQSAVITVRRSADRRPVGIRLVAVAPADRRPVAPTTHQHTIRPARPTGRPTADRSPRLATAAHCRPTGGTR